jgi:DNA repair exonuclease SbcCD nuclease subunit
MAILGHDHVRYSGSIERMDLGEQFDEKSVVLVDLNENGLASAPRLIPIPSCRIRPVIVSEPAVDIPRMRELDSDPSPDLVTLQIRYASGVDDLDTVLRELDVLFPRWYAREWKEVSTLGPSLVAGEADASKGFAEVVREYLAQELAHHDDAEQAAILAALDEFLTEGAA